MTLEKLIAHTINAMMVLFVWCFVVHVAWILVVYVADPYKLVHDVTIKKCRSIFLHKSDTWSIDKKMPQYLLPV